MGSGKLRRHSIQINNIQYIINNGNTQLKTVQKSSEESKLRMTVGLCEPGVELVTALVMMVSDDI